MDKKEEIYPLYRKIVYKILYKPLYNIVVLNIQRFGVFVHTFLENGDQLVVVASDKSCVYWASE